MTENQNISKTNTEKLTKTPQNIDEFILLKHFIGGDHLEKTIRTMDDELKICRTITQYIEESNTQYNLTVMEMFFHSQSWVSKLEFHKTKTEKKFEELKPKFQKELQERIKGVFRDIDHIKDEVFSFAGYYDTNNAEQYYISAKNLMARILELIDVADKMNDYERELGFELTEFSRIYLCIFI